MWLGFSFTNFVKIIIMATFQLVIYLLPFDYKKLNSFSKWYV
jgi:hypothetical protein